MKRLFLLFLLCLTSALLRADDVLSLAGTWRFALDRQDLGTNQQWFTHDLPDQITLPGILEAQGYGDDIAVNTPWVLTLGDAWWKIQSPALRAHFSQPGHVEVPFLAQPPKHYLGAAWYQRDVTIPADWSGRHLTLFLERAHWRSTVWINDQPFPSNDSLVASHITDLGTLPPGKYRLTIRVDNRLQLPAAGHLVDSHSISDGLGAAWNGLVGRLELRSTAPVWIDDAQVFPNVTNHSVRIGVKIGNLSGQPGAGTISAVQDGMDSLAVLASTPVQWDSTGGTASLTVPLPDARPWDEFHPELQSLSLQLTSSSGGRPLATQRVTFGLREITARDQDILINGRPVNLRLTHFGGDFPLTGYPAMDVAGWKKIIQACKDYGLNGMRFHSWCPPEAAFQAADELGFYLQPECGLWADFGSPRLRQWLVAETARILKACGNHPSFILLSPSNEPRNYSKFTPQWAADNYARDPRRLYSAGTGWADPSQVIGGAQYATLVRYGNGQLRNVTGWFGADYGDALTDVHIPVLSHEVGQWCAYPDFDVMNKFTGYLQPGNYDIFKYIAAQTGVLPEDHEFAQASGRFQLQCYKEDIEAALRTPGLAGFQLLELHDYLGQGTALIGVLDAFWESKGYAQPAEFRQFSGPVVPLARLHQRVFTTAEQLTAPVEIANFGAGPLTSVTPQWVITGTDGKSYTSGTFPARDIPLGKNIPLGKITVDLSTLPAPGQYNLYVLANPNSQADSRPAIYSNTNQFIPLFQNHWNFWLYPATAPEPTAGTATVTHDWAVAQTHLAAGDRVLFLPGPADLDARTCPPMRDVPVFWNIQMTVRPPANPRPRFDAMLGLLCETNHPALAEFPTDKNCDWQWTPLINGVRSVNLTTAPRTLRPIVWAIDDWNRNWPLGVIFEFNVGPGRLLVSTIDVDKATGGPGLKQLRRSLLDYLTGDQFHPTATLTPDQTSALWAKASTTPANDPARAFDPDLNDGRTPEKPKPTP